ncbi:MAG: hypothetical protein F4X40_03350, partial [Chloroflexi bacterium]|nr:hypothetical protein [Chloroflexota bacterium]
MKSRNMKIPSLMRMAANAAQSCMNDPECTVDFNSIGVEPGQNSRYVVNLPGAVLVKVFGQDRDKRFGTQGEPPWQASLHEIGRGRLGRGLELALQTEGEVAPANVISEMEEEFRKFDSGIANTQWKIDWVNDCADRLEEIKGWKHSDSLIEFKDYAPRARARLSLTRRPFWKFHEEIAEIVDKNRGLDAASGWGTVDYFEVRDVAKRV